MRKAETDRYVLICADHKLPLGGDGTCTMGHKAQRYRRLDRETNAMGPVTRSVDPASAEGQRVAEGLEARTPPPPPVPPRVAPMPIARPIPAPPLPKIAPPAARCSPDVVPPAKRARRTAAEIVRGGVHTDVTFAEFAQAVMLEVIDGEMKPAVAIAALSAADKLLKLAEMRTRRGLPTPRGADGGLLLVGPEPLG